MTTDFGQDIYCLDSLATGRFARKLRIVGQRCYHRLITPRGTLRGGRHERNFGLDLTGMVGATVDKALTAAMPQRIKNELAKDKQVHAVSVAPISETTVGGLATWRISVEVTTDVGPFELVLSVSEVSVDLLELNT